MAGVAGIGGRCGDGTAKVGPRMTTGLASAVPVGLAGAGSGVPASGDLEADADGDAGVEGVQRRPGVAWAAALAALSAERGAAAGCGSRGAAGGISVVASGVGNAATSRAGATGLPGSVPTVAVVAATGIQSARV